MNTATNRMKKAIITLSSLKQPNSIQFNLMIIFSVFKQQMNTRICRPIFGYHHWLRRSVACMKNEENLTENAILFEIFANILEFVVEKKTAPID